MMQKIKWSLAFLAGAVYASVWWSLFAIPLTDDWKGLLEAIAVVCGAVISAAVIASLIVHWND